MPDSINELMRIKARKNMTRFYHAKVRDFNHGIEVGKNFDCLLSEVGGHAIFLGMRQSDRWATWEAYPPGKANKAWKVIKVALED